jgi:hypothetical protein
MTTLETIQQIVFSHAGHEIIFTDPVQVKSSPHQLVFTCYGVHAEENGVWLMDGAGDWHGPLQEDQGNGRLVINSLYQRLRMLKMEAA